MTLAIGLTLAVIALALLAFVREWAPPDVIALSVLCLVTALRLVPVDEVTSVFRNEAPLAIAALFVIGGAIERTGALEDIARFMERHMAASTRGAILGVCLISGFFSAWMNNTAIVAILLPVTLAFARSKDIPASRLLIPLSYASLLGGCCTLIGTSTNLLVNGMLRDLGERPLTMFELAPLGIPLAIAGIAFLTLAGPRLLPVRASIAGSLDARQRTTPLHHILIDPASPLVGQRLVETSLFAGHKGVHLVEIRRGDQRLMEPLDQIVVQRFDRLLIAVHGAHGGRVKIDEFLRSINATELATVPGLLTELVIPDDSSLVGHSLARVDFRQHYGAVVLAVHRRGVNVTRRFSDLRLECGDTLLVITPSHNLDELASHHDFVLTDAPERTPPRPHSPSRRRANLAWAAIILAVAVTTASDLLHGPFPAVPRIPIHFAALGAALALLWLRVITPRDAYASIDWQVIFMLYGLLALGRAMQETGTARWLADTLMNATRHLVAPASQPLLVLWLAYLLTLLLTEILSNNATAVMMVPIVTTLAHNLGVNPRPFVMAVAVAASAAFALPMGYQTHMMVYGPGGYRFRDFPRVGIPLNLICWIVSCFLIPVIWPFHP